MKFIKFYFIVLILISFNAAFAANLHFKEVGVLSVCSYQYFKPIIYGDGHGYEADLLKAIAHSWGVKIKFYPQEIYKNLWLLPSQKNNPCDLSAGGMTPAEYRKNQGAVFAVHTTTDYNQSLLVRKKDVLSGRITDFSSFKKNNLKIGVVAGTTGESYAHERAKKLGISLAVFVPEKDENTLLQSLRDGKIDAIARGELGNEYQASLNPDFTTIAKENFHDNFSFSVDPTNKELLLALNKVINQLTDNQKISFQAWLKNHDIFMERAVKSPTPNE